MKFEYDKEEDRGGVVAELYEYDGGPELCLCVKAQSNRYVWFYHNETLVSVQDGGFDDSPVKKFYRGDKITITF